VTGIAEGDAGPLRQVFRAGRSVAHQVAPDQAVQILGVVRSRCLRGEPPLDRYECMVPVGHRATHDMAPQAGGGQQVYQCLTFGRHAPSVDSVPQLMTGQRTVGLERIDYQLEGPILVADVDSELAQAPFDPG